MSEQRVDIGGRRAVTMPDRRPSPVRPEPAFSSELVSVCCGALVIAPIVVVATGSFLLFVLAGGLLAASVVVVVAAALEETAGGDEDEDASITALPAWLTVLVMLASVVVAVGAGGGRWWAVPSMLIPAGGGWLTLQSGVAHAVPALVPRPPRADGSGTGAANLQLAYLALVAVVMVPLLAWLLGLV